jgi:hypothetical protein
MNIDDWVNERRDVDFPLNRTQCEIDFFVNTRFHQITYNDLLRHNYPNRLNHRYNLLVGCGIDVLAFYIPFHFHSAPRPWGIYIKDDGVSYLRQIFSQTVHQSIPLTYGNATNLALINLLLHELGHFGVEMLYTDLENLPALAQNNITYENHANEKITNPQVEHNEEAFCNWNVKRQSKFFKLEVENVEIDYYPIIDEFMRNQPLGYRDFSEISNLNYGNNVITAQVFHVSKTKFRRHLGLDMVTRPYPKVPLYLVQSPP